MTDRGMHSPRARPSPHHWVLWQVYVAPLYRELEGFRLTPAFEVVERLAVGFSLSVGQSLDANPPAVDLPRPIDVVQARNMVELALHRSVRSVTRRPRRFHCLAHFERPARTFRKPPSVRKWRPPLCKGDMTPDSTSLLAIFRAFLGGGAGSMCVLSAIATTLHFDPKNGGIRLTSRRGSSSIVTG